jgi:hypothetical protein
MSSWTREVRGGVVLTNQFGSVVSSQGSTTPSNSYLSSIVQARPQHLKKAREPFRRVFLFADPVATGLHFPLVLLYNQDYPKVCPVSLNLPNAG